MKAFLAAALLLLAACPAGAELNPTPDTAAQPANPDPMDALIRRAVARAHLEIKPAPTTQAEIDAAARRRAQHRVKPPLSETPLPQ